MILSKPLLGDKRVHAFAKSISLKVNVIALLELELTYIKAAVSLSLPLSLSLSIYIYIYIYIHESICIYMHISVYINGNSIIFLRSLTSLVISHRTISISPSHKYGSSETRVSPGVSPCHGRIQKRS